MSTIKGPIKRVGEEPRLATSRPNQAPLMRLLEWCVWTASVARTRRGKDPRVSLSPASRRVGKRWDWSSRLESVWLKTASEASLTDSSNSPFGNIVSKRDVYRTFQLFVDHVKDIYSCWKIFFVQAERCPLDSSPSRAAQNLSTRSWMKFETQPFWFQMWKNVSSVLLWCGLVQFSTLQPSQVLLS